MGDGGASPRAAACRDAARCSSARSAAGTTAARARRSPARSSRAPGAPSGSREIDPELFFDFQTTRPHVSFAERRARRSTGPRTASTTPACRRPARARATSLLLLGTEPSLRWRAFCGARHRARDRARRLDGGDARLAARGRAAHAPGAGDRERDRPDACSSELGLQPSRYEGPTGIVGVLHDACRTVEHPVRLALGGGAALRPADAVAPRGKGALRPARRRCSTFRSTRPSSSEASEAYIQQVSEAVAADEETAAYVDELESRVEEIEERAAERRDPRRGAHAVPARTRAGRTTGAAAPERVQYAYPKVNA